MSEQNYEYQEKQHRVRIGCHRVAARGLRSTTDACCECGRTIGDRGKNNSPDSSDGIVPYSSSHLDSAQSELIVPYPHSCAEKTETVHEILRILRLHVGIKK